MKLSLSLSSSAAFLVISILLLSLYQQKAFAQTPTPSPTSPTESPTPSPTESFEETITKPLINELEPEAAALEGQVQSNLEEGNWTEGDPGLWHLGNPAAQVMFEIDHLLLTDLNPHDGPMPPPIPIYTRSRYGGGRTRMRNIDWTDFAAQTAQCNRIDFPYTHLHTYNALHTKPITYNSFPRTSYFIPDHPVIPGINIGTLLAPFEHYLQLYDAIAGNVPGRCCYVPCPWGCCVRHTCFKTKEYQPFRSGYWGLPAGLCLDVEFTIPGTTCCPLKVKAGHVVDYLFPTQKINTSRQPFASRYLNYFEVLSEHLPELRLHLIESTLPGQAPLPIVQMQGDVTKNEKGRTGREVLFGISSTCRHF